MANSRKKISELPALSVASLDTTFVLGISGSTTYKISINNLTSSLDSTFATDLVTNALSNTLDTKLSTSSFNSYTASFTASVASGTISGSSQLTSSFDTRYTLSGSVTQTTWDNISGKPAGIVSQSTDLSSLNTFTASISTASLVNRLNAIENVSGSWITESETGSFLTSLSGAISSSTQISDLGFVTGSYTTINSFNSLTQSFNSISQSFTTISSSVGGVDFSGINAITASYLTFTQSFNTYTASISTGSLVTSISNLNTFTASQSTSSLVNRLNAIESISGSWITESETGSFLTSLNGAISSSSQLTSSYDTRYTLSGSVQPLPSNLLSSSAQITAFGFISASTTIDTGSLVTTSSLNSFSSSVNNRLNSLEGGIATGSVNFVQKLGSRVTGVTSTEITIISQSITTSGNPIQIIITGDAHPLQGGGVPSYTDLQIFRDNTAVGNVVTVQNERFNNIAYSLNFIDSVSAGTYTYSMRTTGSFFGIFDFGEVSGPTITIVELNSQTSFEGTTLISGSSQLTSSFDTRYVASGSISATPAGTISGSAQITTLGFVSGSYETTGRGIISSSANLVTTSSFNSYTASISTASLATTGSNTFIGTETISGSLLLSGSFSYNGTPLQNGFAFAQPIVSKIVSNVAYTGAASWTGTYVSTGGAIIVRADVTGYRASVGTGTAVLYRDGVAVASHSFFFNQANIHTTIPTITYVRNSETGSHTYSIGFTDIVADVNDYLNITILEYGNSAILPATLISGSSQLTSSLDTRYVASGSISATPAGTISGSAQITTLGFVSGSYLTSLSGAISSSSQLTSSFDTRYVTSGSISAVPAGTISGSSQLTSSFDLRYLVTGSVTSSINALNTFTASQSTASLVTSISNLNTFTASQSTASLVTSITNLNTFTASNANTSLNTFTGSVVLTSSFNSFTSSINTWTSSLSAIGTLNTDYIHVGRITSDQISVGAGSDVIFNSMVVSSGISMNTSTGVFTLTAGKTYRLFGSVGFVGFSSATGWFIYQWVDATTNAALDTSGISVGVAEALNRDVNEFNATSANLIYTPSTNQTIKLRITDGNGTTTIRSSIGTKTTIEQINPSVALNQFATLQVSGSLSVTGSLTTKGNATIGTGSGAEGGEIQFAYAQTGNTSLTGSTLTLDVYGDKVRIFEGGGTNKGAYLNVASQSAGVGSSIVTSPNLLTMQTITSASYAALTPVSGTLYIIIG